MIRRFIALSVLLLAAEYAQAHHSFSAEYDNDKPITLSGKVTEMKWSNPHGWIYLDVTAASGTVEKWECEMGSPNQLIRQGWKKEDLPIGTVIRAQANPARVGEHICSTRKITLDDGTPVFSRGAN
jgi:hypothetical protein